jgi:hypothetical protein
MLRGLVKDMAQAILNLDASGAILGGQPCSEEAEGGSKSNMEILFLIDIPEHEVSVVCEPGGLAMYGGKRYPSKGLDRICVDLLVSVLRQRRAQAGEGSQIYRFNTH